MESHFTVTTKFAIKTLEKALKIYTPSLHEKNLAEFLADKCDDLGFNDIHTDEVGNIIATKGSGLPRILLCGHMDTVPGRIRVRKENDFLFGRGSSDAKGPLIAMLFAAASAQEKNGTVMFVGAVDEEGNATGIKNLVKNKPDIDYAIFGHVHSARVGDNYSRSSSMVGANDYSEKALNLTGRASQNCYIFYNNGNRDGIKIDLQNVSNKGYEIDKSLEAYNAKSAKKTNKQETIFKVVV